MNRSQLIARVAEDTGLSAPIIALMLDSVQEVISSNLEKGERTVLPNFGRFELVRRKHRSGTDTSPRQVPGFTPSSELKKRVDPHQD